jgi:hypothetical protein
MVENSVEQLCRQNQRNNSDCFGFIPRYKSCVIHSDSKKKDFICFQKVTHAVSKVRHLPHLPPLRYGHERPDLTDESHPWCLRNDQSVFLNTTDCYYHIYRYFEHQDINLSHTCILIFWAPRYSFFNIALIKQIKSFFFKICQFTPLPHFIQTRPTAVALQCSLPI